MRCLVWLAQSLNENESKNLAQTLDVFICASNTLASWLKAS